ncbi:K+-dependent Na+/Ca+ exchanger related-protein [Lentimicrobium saccharophilum]|uniref:K+-dependent Na+/Ca+ exchanger related-protein n=1 Tax=Lentimicrobium saccharophilum TaxID=1678841 RepID=A0A0S7C3M5_9BACT|nr:calcium/sodium antiporter [Lentimicrobium saccharophilum]GAP44404.1 K+-dependent Na+/Ca+ exchanger related-protein [Lentimicrobium saccharophilum]
MSLLLFIAGMVLLIVGSNWLVDGASSLARRFNISDLVIGLTIVAFGTSSPELIVNLFASFNGNTDIAIGNVVGSNIFNTLAILGLTAIVAPIAVKSTTVWKEIPFSILAVLVMAFMANDMLIDGKFKDIISRIDGFILLCFFSIFMAYTFALAKSSGPLKEVTTVEMSLLKAIIFIITGLAGLFFGGKFLVEGAVSIARFLGISEAVIGLTVVAAGTSMPELATSVVAAIKKKSDIAIGNVVGSNIFNIFFVLGISASIRPIPLATDNSSNFDMIFLIIMSMLLLIFVFLGKEKKINRLEGAIFFLAFVAYTLVLILDTDKSFPFR